MKLVHIGLPKAASTYIQAAALQRGDVQVLQWHTYAQNIVHAACMAAYGDGPGESALTPLQPGDDAPVFVSSEELCGWAPRPPTRSAFHAYQEHVARQLKQDLPDAKVLIVTRSPASFIDSYYNQAVKEGASESPAVFVRRWADLLLGLLDYARLHELYASLFGEANVLLMPVELLRDDAALFYDLIEAHAGFTLRPRSPEGIQQNRSLTEHELQAMRVLNRVVQMLSTNQQDKPEPFRLPHLNSIKRSFLSYYMENDPASKRRSRRILGAIGVGNQQRTASSALLASARMDVLHGLEGLQQNDVAHAYFSRYRKEVQG